MPGSSNTPLTVNNVHTLLKTGLANGQCRAFGEGAAVDTPSLGTFRIPDGLVVCGKIETVDIDGTDAITNPRVIVEVTSHRTAKLDRGPKFEVYKNISTLREYLIVDQYDYKVTHWFIVETPVRNLEQKGDWKWESRDYAAGEFALRSLPVSLNVEEVYRDVEFQTQPE